MKDKKISHLMQILEIVIQCVTFLSAAAAIYFGALDKPDSDVWKGIIIIALVVIAYISRKKIHTFSVFMAVHILIIAFSFIAGTNEGEYFFYFIIFALIAGYSIRLKTITLQKADISGIPLQDNDNMDIAESIEMKKNLSASEQIPFSFCAFMIIGYMAGHAAGRHIIMNTEVILFVLFVLFQVVYNDLKKLNTVFATNKGKQQFPEEQLKRVNTVIIAGTVILMLFAMLLFYNGEYGNIFNIIGMGGLAIFRFILKLIIGIWGSGSAEQSQIIEETTTAAEEEILDGIEEYVPSAAASAAAEVFGIVLMIAAMAGVVYLIYIYAKNFNRKRKSDSDYIEELTSVRAEQKKERVRRVKIKRQAVGSENEAVRQIYKKGVLKGLKNEKPDTTLTPKELTRKTITEDISLSEQITGLYEKARYSNDPISKEETKQLKQIIKHDLTS